MKKATIVNHFIFCWMIQNKEITVIAKLNKHKNNKIKIAILHRAKKISMKLINISFTEMIKYKAIKEREDKNKLIIRTQWN